MHFIACFILVLSACLCVLFQPILYNECVIGPLRALRHQTADLREEPEIFFHVDWYAGRQRREHVKVCPDQGHH